MFSAISRSEGIMDDNMISRNCALCTSQLKEVLYEAVLPSGITIAATVHSQYREPGDPSWWRYRIVNCMNCGHIYADPVFNPHHVADSYITQDHDNHFGIDSDILMRTHNGYARIVAPFLPQKRETQVDIGCDTGSFIRATRCFGFKHVIGVEPGQQVAREAARIAGVKILPILFDHRDFDRHSIQLASMIHVLDHLMAPRQFLAGLRSLMDRDGVVLAVVHNIDSWVALFSGKHWSPIGVMHYDFYTPKTLRQLFEAEHFRVMAIRLTANYFPISHIIRFAPYIPAQLRKWLYLKANGSMLKNVVLRLKLGNIAIIARPCPS